MSNKIAIRPGTVWKWTHVRQYPVKVVGLTNKCDTAGYPLTVTFETITGDSPDDIRSMPAAAFLAALEPSSASSRQFAQLRKMAREHGLV